MKNSTKSTLGAAAATGAAVAAAYYLYGSKHAAQHRRKVTGWAKSAEREIVQKAKQVKKAALSDESIRNMIAEVARRYEMTKDVSANDVREFVGSMQHAWKQAKKSVMSKGTAKKTARATKKIRKGKLKKA